MCYEMSVSTQSRTKKYSGKSHLKKQAKPTQKYMPIFVPVLMSHIQKGQSKAYGCIHIVYNMQFYLTLNVAKICICVNSFERVCECVRARAYGCVHACVCLKTFGKSLNVNKGCKSMRYIKPHKEKNYKGLFPFLIEFLVLVSLTRARIIWGARAPSGGTFLGSWVSMKQARNQK